jgi:hypothetical protein
MLNKDWSTKPSKNRKEWVFQVGDSVFLKLQPYVQAFIGSTGQPEIIF